MIIDFDFNSNRLLIWNVVLRRNLFNYEQEMWTSFSNTISNFQYGSSVLDNVRWGATLNSIYSAKSYSKLVSTNRTTKDVVWSLVWSSIAPPKVEAFL
ncbi:hypothetical protein GQ457_03G040210 [Hibiscus cannabinus]